MNPLNPYDTIMVPDLTNPDLMVEKIVKQESAEIRHGLWRYYDPSTGQVVKTEKFVYGKLEGPKKEASIQANTSEMEPKVLPTVKPKPKEVEKWDKSKKAKIIKQK
jgi:hypothetical protein